LPAGYSGEIFYGVRGLTNDTPRFLRASPVIFERKEPGQAISTANDIQAAHRMAPQLFDDQGGLLPEFRQPLKGKMRSGSPRRLPEWCVGMFFYRLVSERVREIIERHEPGKNLFLPVDVEHDRETQRHYLFYIQLDHIAHALAFRANGVEPRISDQGNPFWNDWRFEVDGQPRFLYLIRAAIGRRKVYLSSHGIFLSKDLVEELGDVLPDALAFQPLGVVDEPHDSPAFRAAAALAAAPH
jgi:hypothetical protein